ncbi:ribonucleotide-diphosphate reductase subunit alpha, partial [mine drainage metagenome]
STTTLKETKDRKDEIIQTYSPGDLVVCNLSSINLGITNTIEKINEIVPVQIRMLDNVITMNTLPLEQAIRTNMRYRAIGVGISGYHQFLAVRGIEWESEEHLNTINEFFEEINFVAIKASMKLAKERGSYPLFRGSDWDNGDYFKLRNYVSGRWNKLSQEVHENGLRNGYIMAIAPTGSTSVIAGSTAGIDPIFKPVFVEEKKGFLVKQVAPDLNTHTLPFYRGAHKIDQMWSIRAAAIRQRHLDQS